jgi:hypothetical protein
MGAPYVGPRRVVHAGAAAAFAHRAFEQPASPALWRARVIGAARDEVDDVELAEAAVFSLHQAARRLRTLAEQARAADPRQRRVTLAGTLDERAGQLHGYGRPSA